MGKFNEELVKAGVMLAGEGLHPSSRGVRMRFSGQQRTVIDGPFAETKELIAGFWIWQVKSMEEAIEWLKRCPNPHEEEGLVEIRPIFSAEDFGDAMTPELREQEASIRAQSLGLDAPQFVDYPARQVAGLNQSYTFETRSEIPAQWGRFAPRMGTIPGQQGPNSYGVCWNYQPVCGFDYLTGVEVAAGSSLPEEFNTIELPAGRYAVFAHRKHISAIADTIDTIWSKWVPDAGLSIREAPCFERYTEEFDPQAGQGGTEIWIPLA